MKTISLTDSAYQRLKTWKGGSKDSFSRVVERLIPARGTLGQIASAAAALPHLTPDQEKTLNECLSEFRDWSTQRDPWTS
jgi:predicted CopG family antitoxin